MVSPGPRPHNLETLILLCPTVLTCFFSRGPDYWFSFLTLLAALSGSGLGIVFGAGRRSAWVALSDLDWLLGGVFVWLLLFWTGGGLAGQLILGLGAGLGLGVGVGLVRTVWPGGAKLLISPALIPAVIAALVTVLLILISPNAAGGSEVLSGGFSWAGVVTLAVAGLGRALIFERGRGWVLSLTSGGLLLLLWFLGPTWVTVPVSETEIQRLSFVFVLVTVVFWTLPPVWAWNRRRKIPKKPELAPTVELMETSKTCTVLNCGHQGSATILATWPGLSSCRLAADHDEGFLLCPYGCLGLGDCLRVCPAGAITLQKKGVTTFTQINSELCLDCGRCRKVCPKDLLVPVPQPRQVFIACTSRSGLKKNGTYCEHSCLGCGRCRKACPAGALVRVGATGALKVDQELCKDYGETCGRVCAEVCPRGLLLVITGKSQV